MVARRTDLAPSQHELDAELAIETVDIPLDRLRRRSRQTELGHRTATVVARPAPTRLPASAQTTLVPAPRVAVSRRLAGLSGIAILILVVTGLAAPTTSGGDWTNGAGWPALQILLVAIGYQLTTRAVLLERPGLRQGQRLFRHFTALIGPIALPTVVVTLVAMAAAASAGRLAAIDVEAAVAAMSMTSNLFALYGSNGPNGFSAGLGSAIGPAIDHFWVTALIAQFGLLIALLVGPLTRSFVWHDSPTPTQARQVEARRILTVSVVAVAAAAISVARLGLLTLGGVEPGSVVAHPLTGIDALVVGMALALLPPKMAGKLHQPAAIAAMTTLTGLFALAATVATDSGATAAWVWGVLAPLVAVAGAGAVSAEVPGVSRFLSSFSLRWLGQRALGILVAYQLLGFALETSGAPAGALTGESIGETISDPFLALPETWDLVASVGVQLVFALALGSVTHRYLQLPLVQAVANTR